MLKILQDLATKRIESFSGTFTLKRRIAFTHLKGDGKIDNAEEKCFVTCLREQYIRD